MTELTEMSDEQLLAALDKANNATPEELERQMRQAEAEWAQICEDLRSLTAG